MECENDRSAMDSENGRNECYVVGQGLYADEYRIILDSNGWGVYEASSEGGHQLANSIDHEIMKIAFIEDLRSEYDSTRSDTQ